MDTGIDAIKELASQTHFSSLDWAIVIVYLLGSVAIGWIGRSYVKDMTDFIGAGRTIGTRLGIATMAGTEMGLITVMYSAQKGFGGGFASFHIPVLAGVVAFFVGVSGFIVTRLREMEVLTIPEFYEKRFGKRVQVLGGILLALGGILNMGLFLKVGAMFIVGITGLSSSGIALKITMTLLIVLVLFYTVLGGMISVVITDYIQFVVLSIGILLTTVLCITNLGWDNIISAIETQQGPAGFDPFSNEGFGSSYVVWMVFLGLVNCAIWPTAIARALIMKSSREVKRQFMWSAIPFTIRQMIPAFWGLCAFAFIYTQAPDLKEAFFPEDPGAEPMDNLLAMPIFLGRILPIGVIGIISAAMIAAFMSTHDSYLLCWSSVITQDIISPLRKGGLSQKGRVLVTRIAIVCIGIYVWVWGIFYEGKQDIWDYMGITGAVYFSGAFALLWGGLYWKGGSSFGAMLSLICGFFAVIGLAPVQELLRLVDGNGDPRFTGAQIGLTIIALSSIAFIIGSLLVPDRKPGTSSQ